jgi:hypothetical protein
LRGLTAPEAENLAAAAEHWVGGNERSLVDELIAAGEPPEVIEAARQREANHPQAHVCWVLPSNWAALQLFLAMATQWDRAGMSGVRTGLNYSRIPVVRAGRPDIQGDWPDLFPRLQLLEAAALNRMNEKRERS